MFREPSNNCKGFGRKPNATGPKTTDTGQEERLSEDWNTQSNTVPDQIGIETIICHYRSPTLRASPCQPTVMQQHIEVGTI